MNILMVGSGKGSFEMRGRQLGAALGARVKTVPSSTDMQWADVVVLIKRALMKWSGVAHQYHKPIVWDALDFWEQERGRNQNGLNEIQSRQLLIDTIRRYQPALVIGATEAMAQAAHGAYLPHHSRPGFTPAPARDVVTTVGYEGTRKYLGQWAKAVQAECDRRGWQFVINPTDLRACDILVAFRDGPWDGWMCREWKSGVKIVNAVAAGRPIITQQSAAVQEIRPIGSVIESPDELSHAFYCWEPTLVRVTASATMTTTAYAEIHDYALTTIAERYRAILQSVVEKAA